MSPPSSQLGNNYESPNAKAFTTCAAIKLLTIQGRVWRWSRVEEGSGRSWASPLRGRLTHQSRCLDFSSQVFPTNSHHCPPPYVTPFLPHPSPLAGEGCPPTGPFTTISLVGLPPSPLKKEKLVENSTQHYFQYAKYSLLLGLYP